MTADEEAIGDTEFIAHQTDPQFANSVQILVRFDVNQQLRFELRAMDEEGGRTEVGSVSVGLRSIPSGDRPLWDLDESPLLGVEAITPESSKNGTLIQFHAHNLHSEGVHQLAPYFTLSLMHNSTKKFPTMLYRSEVHTADPHSPKWKEFIIPTKFLSTSSQSVIEVAVHSFRFNHAEDVCLGKFTVTFVQLLNGSLTKFMLHAAGRRKKEHTFVELVKFDRVAPVPTFLEAIRGGMKLHFTIAIDFTSKNGGPTDPDSLHYVHPSYRAPYLQALLDVAEAVAPYDAQRRVSLLGFGAKVPPHFEFSNCFPLSKNPANTHVHGVENILSTYRRAAMEVHPFAPTNYADSIHSVIKLAKAANKQKHNVYFVLIILTNGCIRDPWDTIDQLVEASKLPISVCFAGVQNESHRMGDGDHSRLTRLIDPTMKSAGNEPLVRECVSYVDYEHTPERTAVRELLSVVPMQATQHLLRLSH
ncbi:VWFA domain-containing protein [Aphelenchoides fujianensis]|nr:VWFA domain-containing protein [Aphelenchoides fujianensis]